jgi:DNA-binding NarL/FixJ family response regulator
MQLLRSRLVVRDRNPWCPHVTTPAPLRVVVSSLCPLGAGALGRRLTAHPTVGDVRAVELPFLQAHLEVAGGDVVVIDLGGGPGLPASLVHLLRGLPAPVALLSRSADVATMLVVLRAGASGYFGTDVGDDELVWGLVRLAMGQCAVDPALAAAMVRDVALRGSQPATGVGAPWALRPRERQVLAALSEGMSNRQIARRLGVGEETVKTHLRTVYRRMGVASRSEAIASYHRGSPYDPELRRLDRAGGG